mgnify:CR=1 FL=1
MSDSCCSHGCAAPSASQSPRYRRVLWAALFINAAMFGIELAGGLQAGSVSLLADAVDFFGDAANYGISLLVLSMALTWRARAALFKGLTMGAFGVFVLGRAAWSAAAGTVPEPVTMGAIAAEGRASKETLYSWFGDLDGLMARLIARNADRAATPLLQALDGPPPPAAAIRPTLEDFALALIALVTSEVSVVINRAAISSPRLAHELTAFGPQRIGAVAAAYFDRLTESGIVFSARGEALFSLFFGLVVQDAQIRALLGAPRPDEAALADQAKKGVDHFLHVATRPRTLDASAYRHF